MAFRQPIPNVVPRQQGSWRDADPVVLPSHTQPQAQLHDSQEWVLFSPTAPSTTRTRTISTEQTPRTAGLSRLSEFGSLDTIEGRSEIWGHVHENQAHDHDSNAVDDDDAEEEELDSLDSHLHAFQEPTVHRRFSEHVGESPMLPQHDGLGMFPASSSNVQEQLYQFEQFNPRRWRRRSSDIRLFEQETQDAQQSERNVRIQEWRIEQSRLLLDEIEKETRRRRMSRVSELTRHGHGATDVSEEVADTSAKGYVEENIEDAATFSIEDGETADTETDDNEPFWKRITRRVIRDIIGIDEPLLSVILGETLPEEAEPTSGRSTSAAVTGTYEAGSLDQQLPWQDRLLARIARELGILVNQYSEQPDAFSTYLQTQRAPAFVGMSPSEQNGAHRTAPKDQHFSHSRQSLSPSSPTFAPNAAFFSPTLPQTSSDAPPHTELWGIDEEDRVPPPLDSTTDTTEKERLRREREYWERSLDAGMVFSFLRNRFRSAPSSQPPHVSSTPQSSAARAAVIRQHHPLTSQSQKPNRRRGSARYTHSAVSPIAHLKRPSSSCASQSATSKRGKTASGSSRNYWDLGGSAGSGSLLAATGGLGAWGEV
ncbi:MAG: hypothetical protein M1833_005811 [Piccolia ochrophora]|nr:MAG: hypothetical protein M1833_005811 [Piccolia ochrophora]